MNERSKDRPLERKKASTKERPTFVRFALELQPMRALAPYSDRWSLLERLHTLQTRWVPQSVMWLEGMNSGLLFWAGHTSKGKRVES